MFSWFVQPKNWWTKTWNTKIWPGIYLSQSVCSCLFIAPKASYLLFCLKTFIKKMWYEKHPLESSTALPTNRNSSPPTGCWPGGQNYVRLMTLLFSVNLNWIRIIFTEPNNSMDLTSLWGPFDLLCNVTLNCYVSWVMCIATNVFALVHQVRSESLLLQSISRHFCVGQIFI